jgi:hypothetical protein
MRILIAQLSGITDLHLLLCIFGLTATTMTFGHLMELLNGEALGTYTVGGASEEPEKAADSASHTVVPQGAFGSSAKRSVSWAPFWLGFVPHMIAWSVVICYFAVAVKRGSPPNWVGIVIVLVFLIDLTFAINQWLQFKQVKAFSGFGKAEFFYIILSLTSKQLLAWVNFGGTNRFQTA